MIDRISFDQAQAYYIRILNFGQIMQNADSFVESDLIRRGDESGDFEISEAVMHGAAKGKLEDKREVLKFDIKDVLRLAHKWAEKRF